MLSDIARKWRLLPVRHPSSGGYASESLNDLCIAAPVSGEFADDAYASSFRPDLIAGCAQRDAAAVSNTSHRAAAIIIETSRETGPSERALGSDRALYRVHKGGVIPRVLRDLLLAVDLAQSYAFFIAERRPRVGRCGILHSQLSVSGLVTFDRTYLEVSIGVAVPFPESVRFLNVGTAF